ncbi:MAG: GatB/YqeY domain-containing protein [Candidatus Levyibacteriota bacterium]
MLKNELQEDLKAAMLAKDEDKLSTIRMLKSALQYFEINKGGAGYEATDEDVIDVVGKEIKKRKESIELYEKGGRPELAEKEKKEIEVLQGYLPEQMPEEEVVKLVSEAVEQTGAKTMQDMGKVMGVLMPKVKGKADAGLVSNLVRQKLGFEN